MADQKTFLSIPEAAGILGITRIAVFKKVKKKQIRAIRVGRNWAVPLSALAAYSLSYIHERRKAAVKPASASGKGASVGPMGVVSAPPAKKIQSPPPGSPAKGTFLKAKKDNLEDMGWD